MARVTSEEVDVILPADTELTDSHIDAAIAAATCTVDQIADGCGKYLNTASLKQVELYLSAHYAAATENTLTISSEKSACTSASVKYGFEFGEGVMGTPFGQMANTISGGCLAEQDKQPIGLFSVGSI